MSSTPAVTEATAASDSELREALLALLGDAGAASAATFSRCGGGVNNRVYYTELPPSDEHSPRSFVLRIYNNGFNAKRVAYEHAVLLDLAHLQSRLPAAERLPFALPTLVPVRAAAGGGAASSTMAALASGAHACLFERIAGGPATLRAARAIGGATAALVRAMSTLPPRRDCPNPQYRNLYASHHATTAASFAAAVAGAPFAAVRADADYLMAAVAGAQAAIDRALALALPEQQIHADVHFDNVLVAADGRVAALLDFEFSSVDWRVMDLVVGLSKYVGLENVEPAFIEWVEGYAAAGGELTADEARLVPDLIIVRILSNVVYFVGRSLAGEDEWSCITSRVGLYANRVRWIRQREQWMASALEQRLVREAAAAEAAAR